MAFNRITINQSVVDYDEVPTQACALAAKQLLYLTIMAVMTCKDFGVRWIHLSSTSAYKEQDQACQLLKSQSWEPEYFSETPRQISIFWSHWADNAENQT